MKGSTLAQVVALSLLQLVSAASKPAPNCTVTAFADVAAAVKGCTNLVLNGVHVPGGQTLDLQKLLVGTTVMFQGTTTFDYADQDIDLIKVSGSNVTVTAAPGAVIDGNGQAWWDGLGSNGGITKPDHFIAIKLTNHSTISNLLIQNYPVHCFTITASADLLLTNITLDNSAGNAPNNRSDGKPASHNSDGFDIATSTNVVLQDSRVVNQDDCVAVTSGNGVTVRNMYCDGGHGLSIGSVGGKSNNNVTNILFEDSVILNSQNGARIKTNSGKTGYIAGITYRNITLTNTSTYGIDIQQDYLNGGPTGTPTNGVTITNITVDNIHGTVTSRAKQYYILCGDGSCSNFVFNDIKITGGTNASCNFHPTGDFVC